MNRSEFSYYLNARRENFYLTKEVLEDKITGNKGYLPRTLFERVVLQHQLRKEHAVHALTETSKNIIINLFKLSISKYSEIRIKAQYILMENLKDFPNAYQILILHITEILGRDTEVHHAAYNVSNLDACKNVQCYINVLNV